MANCIYPGSVEWKSEAKRRPDQDGAVDARPPRAAVCLLGIARFLDATAESLRRNLLERLAMDHDLYAFASAGRREGACGDFRVKFPSRPSAQELQTLAGQLDVRSSSLAREWDVLAGFLEGAVASKLTWHDWPMELLPASGPWQKATKRPGNWLGSLARGTKKRPGSALAQYRSFQDCTEAVQWHERNVLHHEYSYVVASRWDLQWLIPFPGLPLLQSTDPEAVWVPGMQGDFYANDRFAAVPRRHAAAYFGVWQLIVSGRSEEVFNEQLPGSGLPVYDAENVNTETFLWARLAHAGVRVAGLPALAYVHCAPSQDLTSLRTLGYWSCTSFSQILGASNVRPEFLATLGGAKYPREFNAIVMTDNVLNGILHADLVEVSSATSADRQTGLPPRMTRLFPRDGVQRQPEWTQENLMAASFVGAQLEISRHLKEKDCLVPAEMKSSLVRCRRFLRVVLSLATLRGEFYEDALALARARVIAAPLHLESWLWLTLVLMHPYLKMQAAAAASARQALVLNGGHTCAQSMHAMLLQDRPAPTLQDLDEALGGPNATRASQAARRQVTCRLKRRRAARARVVGSCVAARSSPCLDSWLAFGSLFMHEGWLSAAAGVVVVLRADLWVEGEEATRPEEDPRVLAFEAKLRRAVEQPEGWATWGASLEDHLLDAPGRSDLLDEGWLRGQEARTGQGGRDLQAAGIRNVVFSYSPAWQRMVAVEFSTVP